MLGNCALCGVPMYAVAFPTPLGYVCGACRAIPCPEHSIKSAPPGAVEVKS